MTTTMDSEMTVPRQRRGGTLLVDLPPELLSAICVSVACPTVVWCRLVCRRLKDVIDGSLELQYRIELVRDGMIDVDAHTPYYYYPTPSVHCQWQGLTKMTSAERLVRLRALRRAWYTLDWTRCVTIPIPGPCRAYELVGGVFCKTQPTVRRRARGGGPGGHGHGQGQGQGQGQGRGVGAGGGWPGITVHVPAGPPPEGLGDVDDEEPAHVPGSRTMSATWLPTSGTGAGAGAPDSRNLVRGEGGRWRTVVRDDLGIPTRDFAMDPSQDLMVLFKGGEDPGLPMVVVFPGVLELHVRTMSTNETHPEAGVPVLCTAVLYPVTSVFVQIVDDVVGIMYCVDPARPRITVWNWKTGQLVVDRSSSNLPPGTWDFSFVNSRALFVTTGNGSGSLELFTFTCNPVDASADSDASPFEPAQPVEPLTHVASLHLPPIYPSVRVLSVGTHTGPFLAACPLDAPFVSSNEDRIYVLTVQYVHLHTLGGPRTRPRMCVFLHQRTLERYLARGTAHLKGVPRLGDASTPMEVPWLEWGPRHARMLPHAGVFQWLRYVHGQRVVMLLPSSKAGKSTLQVLDFNVRRAFDNDDTHDKEEGGSQTERNDADLSLRKAATFERVYYPTRIVMPNIFLDIVESGLPYRDARRDVCGEYSGVMIDDERLVGLKYPAFLTGDMKEMDVFTM